MTDDTNGDDYIFRGNPPTPPSPQDGQPWERPAPPPGPPPTSPHPTTPPPGFPPHQSAPGVGQPEKVKKKRWPWILAAVVLLCGLPLGGCVALVAFGVSELNERADEIEATAADFFDAVDSGQQSVVESLADGEAPCATSGQLVETLGEFGVGSNWTAERTGFVERGVNSTLSSNADPETLFIDGRPNQSAGLVDGRLESSSGTLNVQVLFSRPLGVWRICTIVRR